MRHQLENTNIKLVSTSSTVEENSSSVLETSDYSGSVEDSKYEKMSEENTNIKLVSTSSTVDENSSSVLETSDYSGSVEDSKYEKMSEENTNIKLVSTSSTVDGNSSSVLETSDYSGSVEDSKYEKMSEDGLIYSNDEGGFSMGATVLSFAEPNSDINTVHDKTKYNSILSSSQGKTFQQQFWVSSSISGNDSLVRESSSEPPLSDHDSIFHKDDVKGESYATFVSKVAVLSNKERLILRKQALKMKKRPVFAIGRNNVITGVAKAITAHFKKYPLAIVNVKGRAKGTSVQELVFELEQATGAVMVSREPNKIILYRGWGEQDPADVKEKRNLARPSEGIMAVSPQLMAAISLECEVLASQEDITVQ